MSDEAEYPDQFSEAETLGVWIYVDEDGEEVTVLEDACQGEDVELEP
jgi:hypothetical protein